MRKTIAEIDEMEGVEFERFCAATLSSQGFTNISLTPSSGDFGVDVLAYRNGEKYAIQCKRYDGNVGNHAVQEAYAGMRYYNANHAIVITNSFFTEQAKEAASRLGVELWDRNYFIRSNGEYSLFGIKQNLSKSKKNKKTNKNKSSIGEVLFSIVLWFVFALGIIILLINLLISALSNFYYFAENLRWSTNLFIRIIGDALYWGSFLPVLYPVILLVKALIKLIIKIGSKTVYYNQNEENIYDKTYELPTKKIILICAICFLSISGIVEAGREINKIGLIIMSKSTDSELSEYRNLYNETLDLIISNDELTMNRGELVYKILDNCEHSRENRETDKYTHDESGKFFEQRYDAVRAYYRSDEALSELFAIKTNYYKIKENMEILENYPSKYKKSYNTLNRVFLEHKNIIELVTNENTDLYFEIGSVNMHRRVIKRIIKWVLPFTD